MRRRQIERFLRLTGLLVAAHVAAGAAGCARPVPIFSEQNARAHVGMLAGTIGSRPVGTEANARARAYIIDQLRLFGYEVRVQEADARRASLGRSARVANIIAVKTGARSEAVALVSHYDSVPMGPGAADDAFGVAVSLEAARVLAARPNPNWSVMVLVTDGEDAGLMGAAALMTDRDVTNRLKAYINFESIGSGGTPMLFEVGPGNGWLLRPWARYAPNPRGGSFITEIYKRLPNDTDFSIFKLQEIPGLNFAAVGDSFPYHTSRDTVERLAPGTVRRAGEQAVAIVTALDGIDVTQRTAEVRTYFDIASTAAFSYGPLTASIVAVAALVLGVIAWVKATAAAIRLEGILRWVLTTAWIMAGAVASAAAMVGATWALRSAREVYHPWYARPGRLFLLLLAIGISVAWGAARLGRWLPERLHGVRHPIVVWSVALPAWIGVAGGALWLAPAAAYLWLVPLLAVAGLLVVTPATNPAAVRSVSVLALAIAATFWIANTNDLLRFVVAELGRQPIVTPVFVFTVMMALAGLMVAPPLLATVISTRPLLRPSLATALCLLAIALTSGFAYVAPAYTPDHPLRRSVRVVQDGDGPAVWDVASIEPGVDLGEGAPTGWTPVAAAPAVSAPQRRLPHPFVFRATTPSLGPAPLGIAAIAATPLPAGSELTVTVVPKHPGLTVSFVLPAGLEPARSTLPGTLRLGRWTATYIAPPADGLAFRASFNQIAPERLRGFRVLVSTAGGPGGQGWELPQWLPRERTAWQSEATWILDPLSLPIAPVPPLR